LNGQAQQSAYRYTPVPVLQDNYVWIISDGQYAVVVDPGDATLVEAYLSHQGWQLHAILLTHHHHDHTGGLAGLLHRHTVPVYGPWREKIAGVTHPVKGGDIIRLSGPLSLEFAVLDITGHTLGHIAYFQEGGQADPPHVLCGDTLFACGCGRLFEGTPQQMLASLDMLAGLPHATQVHCAHEYTLKNIDFALMCDPENVQLQEWRCRARAMRARGEPTLPTTIGWEKCTNPFLRAGYPAIQHQLALALAVPIHDRLEAFTAMRKWKDQIATVSLAYT